MEQLLQQHLAAHLHKQQDQLQGSPSMAANNSACANNQARPEDADAASLRARSTTTTTTTTTSSALRALLNLRRSCSPPEQSIASAAAGVADVNRMLQAVADAAQHIRHKRESLQQERAAAEVQTSRAVAQLQPEQVQQLRALLQASLSAGGAASPLELLAQSAAENTVALVNQVESNTTAAMAAAASRAAGTPAAAPLSPSAAAAKSPLDPAAVVAALAAAAASPRDGGSGAKPQASAPMQQAPSAAGLMRSPPSRTISRVWADTVKASRPAPAPAAAPAAASSGSAVPGMLQALLEQVKQLPPLLEVIKQERAAAAARGEGEGEPSAAGLASSTEAALVRLGSGQLEAALRQAAGLAEQAASGGASSLGAAANGDLLGNLPLVLQEVLAAKQQAAACIRDAIRLGLLVQMAPLEPTCSSGLSGPPAPAPTQAAVKEEPAVAAQADSQKKRSRGEAAEPGTAGSGQAASAADTAAAAASPERPVKLQRCGLEAAQPAAADAMDTDTAAAEAPRALNRSGSNASEAESSGAHVALRASGGCSFNCRLEVPRAAEAAGAAMAPAGFPCSLQEVQALFARTLAVLSRSQSVGKQLASMVVPCAAAARISRQQSRNLVLQAQQVSQHADVAFASLKQEQDTVVSLKQQLELARLALAVKQQHVTRLRQEAQAATATHAAQLQSVGQAVNKLVELAGSDTLKLPEKRRLMAITTEILQSVL